MRKARPELQKLARRAESGRIRRDVLEARIQKALQREHLSELVITEITEHDGKLSLNWRIDQAARRLLERTRLGRRVLCTDRHIWSTGRIVNAFRGQWNVEELFRRAKKGGIVPWGSSHQWVDSSLRLHTFATVIGLELVSPPMATSKSPTCGQVKIPHPGRQYDGNLLTIRSEIQAYSFFIRRLSVCSPSA